MCQSAGNIETQYTENLSDVQNLDSTHVFLSSVVFFNLCSCLIFPSFFLDFKDDWLPEITAATHFLAIKSQLVTVAGFHIPTTNSSSRFHVYNCICIKITAACHWSVGLVLLTRSREQRDTTSSGRMLNANISI